MKTSPLKIGLIIAALAGLPLLVSAQEKATLAISSIQATPALLETVGTKTVTTTTTDTKREKLEFNTRLELKRVMESLDGQLIDRINATRKFTVVGRSDLADVIKEQDLGASGNVDSKTAAPAGKLAGAKYLLTATVDDFQDYLEKAVFTGTDQTATKRVFRFSVVAKIYDAGTGKLLESANFQTGNDEFKQIQTDRSYAIQNGDLSDEMLVAIARSMAEKIALHAADVIFPIKVLVKRDNVVTINRGEGGGVTMGEIFNVFAQGQELKDPDTGEVLGREEVKVGRVKISQVNAKLSQAEVLEDTGIDQGCVLRKATP